MDAKLPIMLGVKKINILLYYPCSGVPFWNTLFCVRARNGALS